MGQGECPEPIRNHLCEQNDHHSTQEYSGPGWGGAKKMHIFIGFRTIKKNRCYIIMRHVENTTINSVMLYITRLHPQGKGGPLTGPQ